jgi:aminoglycoside phosphotransferase (APT) family kinase protein
MTNKLTNKLTDEASAVRPGEELPITSLVEWMNAHIPDLLGTPKVTQYSGGASNSTYCLKFENKSVILRRPPAGTKAKGAHDMGREYRLQAALQSVYPKVPEMLGYTDDESVIGAEFYIMQKLDGIIPRQNMPRDLTISAADAHKLCESALDGLIELHNVDYKAAGLAHIAKGEGYTKRQISGWTGRYQKAKTWNVPKGKKVTDWLANNIPSEEKICITHNDYRFDNLVLNAQNPQQIMGVLDWELATLGDPLMDLGNSLAYWVQADDDWLARRTRRQPTHLPGMMTRKEVIQYYCDKQGLKTEDFAFYEVYGLFRLAAIVQQIYYRYHHKQTRNPQYKHLWIYVHYLLHRCRKIINKNK